MKLGFILLIPGNQQRINQSKSNFYLALNLVHLVHLPDTFFLNNEEDKGCLKADCPNLTHILRNKVNFLGSLKWLEEIDSQLTEFQWF